MNTGRAGRRDSAAPAGMIQRVPNQPKTTIRGIRIPDDEWADAKRVAADEGRSASAMFRALARAHVKRHDRRKGKP